MTEKRSFNPQSLAAFNAENGVVDNAIIVFDREKEPSLTVQSDADKCNINKIMAHFEKTGSIDHLATVPVRYGDVSEVQDFHSMMNYVTGVQSEFNMLPADVRARFNNDAGAMLDFLLDPKNQDEAIRLGWLEKAGVAEVAATSQTKAAPAASGTDAPPKVV